jgi:hypothetical protein
MEVGPTARKSFLKTPDVSALLRQRTENDSCFAADYFHACLLQLADMSDHANLQSDMHQEGRHCALPEGRNIFSEVEHINAADVPPPGEQRPSPGGSGAMGISMRGFFLDVAGSFSRPPLTDLDLHSDLEIACLATRMADAFDRIALVEGVVYDLLRKTLQVIVLRKDSTNLCSFASSSWPGCIGLMALTNAHRQDLADAWIVDALVHESIHTFLYSIECFEPFYSSETQALGGAIVSPWSGRTLKLHSYVHACFVWYGLWCFWRLATERHRFIGPSVDFLRDRARGGFMKGDVLARLGAEHEQITQPISEAIATLQRIVIAS